MIVKEIRSLLDKNGYSQVTVNVNNIYLHYKVNDRIPLVIALLECEQNSSYTKEQYDNIIRQLRIKFLSEGNLEPRVLSIICSTNLELVRELRNNEVLRNCDEVSGNNECQWFIDLTNSRLIIYENQENIFRDLKKEIEELLYTNRLSIKERNLNQANEYKTAYANKQSIEDIGKDNYVRNNRYKMKHQKGSKHFSICNTSIVIINVIVFLIIEMIGSSENSELMLKSGAMYWPSMINDKEYYRLFTYMFLHFGIAHLANNMIVLGFIGDNLEREVGKIRYITIYFGAGVLAGIVSMSYNIIQRNPVISAGASGAIFGIVGAMLYVVVINKGRLEEISTVQLVLFILFSLYGGLTSQGTDNMAHIGGFVSGIVLAALLYRQGIKTKNKDKE